MLKTTPEYMSAHLRDLAGAAPTALAAEAMAHRRDERHKKLSRFIATIYRATPFAKEAREAEVAPSEPKPAT